MEAVSVKKPFTKEQKEALRDFFMSIAPIIYHFIVEKGYAETKKELENTKRYLEEMKETKPILDGITNPNSTNNQQPGGSKTRRRRRYKGGAGNALLIVVFKVALLLLVLFGCYTNQKLIIWILSPSAISENGKQALQMVFSNTTIETCSTEGPVNMNVLCFFINAIMAMLNEQNLDEGLHQSKLDNLMSKVDAAISSYDGLLDESTKTRIVAVTSLTTSPLLVLGGLMFLWKVINTVVDGALSVISSGDLPINALKHAVESAESADQLVHNLRGQDVEVKRLLRSIVEQLQREEQREAQARPALEQGQQGGKPRKRTPSKKTKPKKKPSAKKHVDASKKKKAAPKK